MPQILKALTQIMIHALTSFIVPENDTKRLEKLYEYQILDTHPEDTFDKIALLASQIFEAPFAFISFVDRERVFLKANISHFEGNVLPRHKSPCALAILDENFTVFNDTLEVEYLKNNPLIEEEGGIRFYAAAPLKTPEGYLLGTVCVADTTPHESPVCPKKLEMLKSLSEIVVNKLESRLRYKNLLKAQNELMHITLHEIKNPLASINLANDVALKAPARQEDMYLTIKQSVSRIQSKLHDLLQYSELEEAQERLNIEETDLRDIFDSLIKNFQLQASKKRQVINILLEESLPKIYIDRKKISDVFHNLLSNAIKYSYFDSPLHIYARRQQNSIEVEFRDFGQGLSKQDMDNLFKKFAKLSARPTGKETSNGLGLSICKSFVEMHHGRIYAKSLGKNMGSSFYVSLPMIYEMENC